MFYTNLRVIFRSLWKSKTTSFVNILGFAFSLAVCITITLYILNEFSYDRFNKNFSNIFRIVNDENNRSQVDYSVKEDILEEIPDISGSCHILLRRGKTRVEYQNIGIDIGNLASTDNDFFRIFSFPLLIGNQDEPFDHDNNSILISEKVSRILFGKEDPVEKRVKLNNKDEYTVRGVFKNIPANSSIYADIFFNETYEINKRAEHYQKDGKEEYQRTVFLTLNSRTQISDVTEKIDNLLAGKDKLLKRIRLQPLKEIYMFDNTTNWDFNKGNYQLITLFIGIGFIILLLASLNYINLSVAQYNQRIKETGVRKTLGASRFRLIRNFLAESVIVTIISLILAFIITDALLPVFNSIFSIDLHLSSLISVKYIALFITGIVLLGLMNGIWPAIIISSFNPVQIFQKRYLKINGSHRFRPLLTTIQFSASITLIICVLFIVKQLSFIKHKDLGFRDDNLIKISAENITNFDPLRNRLLQNPSITDITFSSGVPGIINDGYEPGMDAEHYNHGVAVIRSDDSFVRTFQIEILSGRDFSKTDNSNVCLVNETACRDFGWGNEWSEKYFRKERDNPGYKVIGVLRDFNFRSLYQEIEPLVIEYNDIQKNILTLRISDRNLTGTLDYINKIWKEVEPDVSLDFAFYDKWFDSMYENEERLAKMVGSFALLAIIISCLGLFSQAVLSSVNRTKEIGIRKINGAEISEIIIMLNRDLSRWVSFAFLFAAPLSFYIMKRWYHNFAFKSGLSWWIFLSGGLIAATVALLAVSWQSWKAAKINPIDCLRDE